MIGLAEALDLAAAAVEFIEASERRSLRHRVHARSINPIHRKVKRLMAGMFKRQGADIVDAVRPRLQESEKEDAEDRALQYFPDSVSPLIFTATATEQADYQALISYAIRKAEAQLESELASGARIPDTAMSGYLERNSLGKLTGDFAETTKQRIRAAITGAVQSGGTADQITRAIQAEVRQFSSVRAEMIAQTEVNNAYNWGRSEMATAAGLNEKEWVTESGNPCQICIDNEAEGWIGITDAFLSGDQLPCAHPRCFCSLDFRLKA